MNRPTTKLAKLYLGTLVALGLATVLETHLVLDAPAPVRFGVFAALTVLSSWFQIRLPADQGSLSPNFFFILLALPQFSAGEVVALGILGCVMECFVRRGEGDTRIEKLFRLSLTALGCELSWKLFHSPLWQPLGLEYPIRIVFAGALHFVVQTWPLISVSALIERRPLVASWYESSRWSFPYYLLGAAFVGASDWTQAEASGQTITMGLGALFLMYRSYSAYMLLLESERNRALTDRQRAEETSQLHLRTIQALALAIEAKDHVTKSHLNRVRVYSEALGRELGMSEPELEALKAAALLHDIGKLAVPEHILSKPGSLTPEEFEKMKIHTLVGAEIVESVSFPYPVSPIVRGHHEHWDGTGYPDRLRGEHIPLGARILAAVDNLDSLASPRDYRPARPLKDALAYVVSEGGRRFDPQVVSLLAHRMQELEARVQATVQPEEAPEVAPRSPEEFIGRIGAARNEAQVLFEISQAVGTTLRLDSALSAFAQGIQKLVPFDTAALYILDNTTLRAECALGDEATLFASLEIPMGQGLTGYVAETGTPIFNGNPAVEPAYLNDESRFTNLRSALVVPLRGDDGVVGVLALYSQHKDAFTKDHLRILGAASSTLGTTIENVRRYREAEDSAGIDFLTELPNARSLSLHLDREFARCSRSNEALIVMIGDLDGFKQVNDRLGHLTGNRLLQAVAGSLKAQCRGNDFIARMGGDEFALVLTGLPVLSTPEMVERFTRAVEAASRNLSEEYTVSLSLGLARLGIDGQTPDELLEVADRRMYEAKTQRKLVSRASSLRPERAAPEATRVVNE